MQGRKHRELTLGRVEHLARRAGSPNRAVLRSSAREFAFEDFREFRGRHKPIDHFFIHKKRGRGGHAQGRAAVDVLLHARRLAIPRRKTCVELRGVEAQCHGVIAQLRIREDGVARAVDRGVDQFLVGEKIAQIARTLRGSGRRLRSRVDVS